MKSGYNLTWIQQRNPLNVSDQEKQEYGQASYQIMPHQLLIRTNAKPLNQI